MNGSERLSEIFERAPRRRVGWGRRRDRLDLVIAMLDRLDASLVVRDPGSARSAEVFEGLRRQVLAAAGDRRRHVVQLTEFAEAVRRGDNAEALQSRVEEWLVQANVQVVTDPSSTAAFEISGPDDGTEVTVVLPAYVDGTTGMLIRQGIAERVRTAAAVVDVSPGVATHSEPAPGHEEPAAEPPAAAARPGGDEAADGESSAADKGEAS